ncbi:MAG TPA: aminotransferase class I/II-fold pyridoxal phosphate-dependent enzyme [Flavitalea sp.]|nr:aminotransferase class I/II-fold pyridoxal phosphate-dependent enzyme [Flavitalea sp.]
MITASQRLDGIGEYYFSTKLREIDSLRKQGKDIINLGIGSPDLAPHPDVVDVLHREALKPSVHGYQSYKGSPVLRTAIADWYKKWYTVELNPETEILPLIGSKEGIMHICMAFLNNGDQVLVPNPGYPTYRSAVKLAGGECIDYDLLESDNWSPDFKSIGAYIESQPAGKVKLLFVNYPHMPTGQLGSEKLFSQVVQFAKQHKLLVVHDNPYSFILNDNPTSILSTEGALDVVIELNSLSKSHNMAGWRVGMLCGAASIINDVMRFKSNMDSGMFLPLQLAAAKALTLGRDWHDDLNKVYAERRAKVFEMLDMISCTYSTDQAGMFVWAKIPEGFDDGYAVSDRILYNTDVFITPGGIFGSAGDHFIRVSLCTPVERLEEAISRIRKHPLMPTRTTAI